jgi:hypothetical protein
VAGTPELPYWYSAPFSLKMTSAISQLQRMESSYAFLMSPLRRFLNVTYTREQRRKHATEPNRPQTGVLDRVDDDLLASHDLKVRKWQADEKGAVQAARRAAELLGMQDTHTCAKIAFWLLGLILLNAPAQKEWHCITLINTEPNTGPSLLRVNVRLAEV